jgi:hypothetical protein
MKTKEGRKPASGKGRGQRGGRNTERDFHGEKRRNDTHSSTTDADARCSAKPPARRPSSATWGI